MAIPITNVTPATVPLDGGDTITLTGTFPAGDLTVRVGPAGDATDPPCYSGDIGSGYDCQRTDASTLTAITPPMPRGDNKVSVYSPTDSGLWAGTLSVPEHHHLTSTFELRGTFPDWADTGPRSLTEEPRQDSGASYQLASKSPTRATFEAVGEAIAELCGFRLTRLRSVVLVGATELPVESAEGFYGAGGTIWVGEERAAVTYTGVDLTPTAQRFTGVSGITVAHREETEIVDGSREWSKLDMLRRALLVAYAEGADLDRIGRRHAVKRPLGISDTTYRELTQVIAYLARGPVYALEQVLDVFYPLGGWSIYESLLEHPLQIEIRMPGAVGDDPAGRCFMMQRETIALGSTTLIDLSNEPISVEKVVSPYREQTAIMDMLPSVIIAPYDWTYVAELAGAEGAYFSIVAGQLQQKINPVGTNGGRYRRTINELGQTVNRIDAAWRWDVLSTVNAYPWKMLFRDGEREYCFMWNQTHAALGQYDGTLVSAAYAFAAPLTNAWQYPTLIRNGSLVQAYWNGIKIIEESADSFAANGARRVSFGYFDTGLNQDWFVYWGWLHVGTKNDHNYWNLHRSDGQLTTGLVTLDSASAPFLAGHMDKRVRVWPGLPENSTLWRITAVVGPAQVEINGVTRYGGRTDSLNDDRLYESAPWFADAEGKIVTIPAGPNAGSYPVAVVHSPFEVELTGAAFTTEEGIAWYYDSASLLNEAGVSFEIVDAGTKVGTVLTMPDAVPGLPFLAEVHYSDVLSGQVLADETVENDGTSYWPFYVIGADQRVQEIVSDVTLAGVIPKFSVLYK